MIVPIIFGLFMIPTSNMIYGDHDHDEGSGGCSGDCVPPTLGVDHEGTILVENGFSINNKSYNVEHFKQNVPTQTVSAGTPVEITLRVFENSGPTYLKNVGLLLGIEKKFQDVTWIDLPNAEIYWEQNFDGTESILIENSNNFITDVGVDVEVDNTITILKFYFTPTEPFDTNRIIVKMWDQNRSFWANSFYDALKILPNMSSVVAIEDDTHESESHDTPESESHDTHESNDDFQCELGLEKVLRTSTLTPVCVSSYAASVLIEYGWAVTAH